MMRVWEGVNELQACRGVDARPMELAWHAPFHHASVGPCSSLAVLSYHTYNIEQGSRLRGALYP